VYEAEIGAAPLTVAQSQFADVPTKCIDPPVLPEARKTAKGTSPYSNIFEDGQTRIVLYPYRIVFIFSRIHIQVKVPGPYRIRMYLNIFKIYFGVSYFWPALGRVGGQFRLLLLGF
jgi:hypothetical protein